MASGTRKEGGGKAGGGDIAAPGSAGRIERMEGNILSSRTYTRENKVYPKDENGHTSVFRCYVESTDHFAFSLCPGSNNLLTVTKNGASKTVYIEDCGSEYVFKLLKTKIKANHGASGLFEFIDKALTEKFMDCYAWKILDHIADNMKAVKGGVQV